MANIFTRLFQGTSETRAYKAPTAPARMTSKTVNASSALTLTAVYRAVQIIATPVSAMPLMTFRYATGMEMPVPNPLFINKPSLEEARRETLYQTVASMMLHGEAFWLKNYGSNGQVNNIQILPANLVQVMEDEAGVKYYMYKERKYALDRIEHIKLMSLPGVLRGIGPVQRCAADLAGILDLRDFQSTWFAQAGIPTGVLKSQSMLTRETAQQIRESWLEAQSERTIAVIGNGTDYQFTQITPREAMMTDVQAQADQKVARMFGIPARLMLTGVDGTSDTYSNLTDENQVFYRHTIRSYTDPIEDALSNCLPRGTSCEFDFEGLFKSDVSGRYNYYKTGIDAGFLTVEEVRRKEGLDV